MRSSNLAQQTESFLFNHWTFTPPLFFFRKGTLWRCLFFCCLFFFKTNGWQIKSLPHEVSGLSGLAD